MDDKFLNQENLNHLPIPDEELSWQKMQEKLDEEKKRRRFLPPFLFSTAFWVGILLGSLVTVYFIANSLLDKDGSIKERADKTSGKEVVNANKITDSKNEERNITSTKKLENLSNVDQEKLRNENSLAEKRFSIGNDHILKKSSPAQDKTRKLFTKEKASFPQIIGNGKRINEASKDVEINDHKKEFKERFVDYEMHERVVVNVDTSIIAAVANAEKQKEKTLYWSVGLSEQQQIPLPGQKAIPYNYYGRKFSLSDYIPSVYLRYHHKEKWFLQGEFRYGAPQTVKEVSYSQTTNVDVAATNITTTIYRLKKTYYHQIPLSFNYQLQKNLSVGVGALYSRFYGAVTEKEVRNKNIQTQVETVSKEIVNIQGFKDSFLYKTQAHILLQSEYQWRRLGVGLRYTKDLQPFIKYTKPDGDVDELRNESLQLFVRFRLWQSK